NRQNVSFPLANLPTTERAHNAIIGALIDVVMTLPELPPDVVDRLRQLRGPELDFTAAIRIAHELSAVCREHQARLGRS
ncbi:MAG: hypothetical protein AB7O95_22715, partial [Geminicoccaceae bacterium]